MTDTARTRSLMILSGVALGAAASMLTTLVRHVQHELLRRGYPSWDNCQCDYKDQETIFQVLHSHHSQRGETIVSHEWGLYLVRPPQWMRRFLHHSSQVAATLNPLDYYVERVTLNPQESLRFAALLHTRSSNSNDVPQDTPFENPYVVWRREVLHFPRYPFDACIRRLYPAHIPQERLPLAEPLPAIWDPKSDLPLPTEGSLLDTPIGTRIDCIGWTPTQISYCTARLKGA